MLTISSRVFPRSIDGAGTDIWVDVVVADVVVVGAPVAGFSIGETLAYEHSEMPAEHIPSFLAFVEPKRPKAAVNYIRYRHIKM